MRRSALILVLSGLLAPAIGAATAVQGWLQFGLRPDNQRLGYFAYEIEPGASITDALLVVNQSDQELKLRVQPAAAGVALNGGLAFDRRDAGADVAAWIDIPDAGQVQVPPDRALRLPFTVHVPADAQPGEYAAGFLAALVDPSDAFPARTEGVMNVDFVAQSAVALIVTVPGRLQRAMTIDAITAGFKDGRWTIWVDMRNTGNVHFRGSGRLTLVAPDGARPLEQDFAVGYIPAGKALRYPLVTAAPASGAYLVEVALTSTQGTRPLASRVQSVQVGAPPEPVARTTRGTEASAAAAPGPITAPGVTTAPADRAAMGIFVIGAGALAVAGGAVLRRRTRAARRGGQSDG